MCKYKRSKKHVEGLNSKVKLQLYKSFGKEVDFKTYLHRVSDAETRLLFKVRSGTHDLNEELGRHGGRNGRTECILCGPECESVVHVLWECPAYNDKREGFIWLRSGPYFVVDCSPIINRLSNKF